MATYEGIPIDKDVLCKIDEQTQRMLAMFTVMFYLKSERGKEGIGSGIFVAYDSKNYLITAGHVFQNLKEDHCFLKKVYVDFINISLAEFTLPAIYLPEYEKDHFSEPDYAIFPVNERISKLFACIGMHPYQIPEYVKHSRNVMFRSLVFGYPASFNEAKKKRFQKDAQKTKYYCLDLPWHLHSEDIPFFNAEYNIALEFSKKEVLSSEDIETRIKRNAPPLNGMSGCGIWSVLSYPFAVTAPILLGMFTSISTEHDAVIGFSVQDMVIALEKAAEFNTSCDKATD